MRAEFCFRVGEFCFREFQRFFDQCVVMPDTITQAQFADAFQNGGFRRTVAALRKRGANLTQAEDIAQDAWGVHGWTKRHQLKDPRRLIQWVTQIAINSLWDQRAKEGRLTTLPYDGREPGIAPAVNLAGIDVARCLRRCSDRQQNLLKSVYLLGATASEAAKDLGISTDALHHRLSRARRTAGGMDTGRTSRQRPSSSRAALQARS